jgi:hypothetical protein
MVTGGKAAYRTYKQNASAQAATMSITAGDIGVSPTHGRARISVRHSDPAADRPRSPFMLDPKGIVSTWNAGAQRLKGYRVEEIIGQHDSRFYPTEDRRRASANRELAIAENAGRFEEEAWRVRVRLTVPVGAR